jgi:hypothetical protein
MRYTTKLPNSSGETYEKPSKRNDNKQRVTSHIWFRLAITDGSNVVCNEAVMTCAAIRVKGLRETAERRTHKQAGAGLRTGWSGIRVPAGARNFSLRHRVQNGSGAHPVSYPMGTRCSFLGIKRPRHEVDHSPTSSAEVMNAWSYISTPPYAWCSVKAQGEFYVYLRHKLVSWEKFQLGTSQLRSTRHINYTTKLRFIWKCSQF